MGDDREGEARTPQELRAALARAESAARRLAVLDRFDEAVRRHPDRRDGLQAALEVVHEALDADRTYVVRRDRAHHTLDIFATCMKPGWVDDATRVGQALPFDDGFAAITEALRAAGKPIVLGPGQGIPEKLRKLGVRSALYSKFSPTDTPLGTLAVHRCADDHVWSPEQVSLFGALALRVADAVAVWEIEDARRATDEHLHTVLGAISDAVVVLDEHGVYQAVYSTMEADLAAARAHRVGRRLHDVWPKDLADTLVDIVRRALGSDGPIEHEYSAVIDGTERWFSARVGAIGPMPADRVVWLSREVTRERLLAIQLRQRHKLEGLGLLARGLSTDFNNLLVGVLGNAAIARDAADPGRNDVHEALAEITSSGKRAQALCRSLAAYSGGGWLNPTAFTPTEIVAAACETIREDAGLVLAAPARSGDKTGAMGDRGLLVQAVAHVIQNALEAVGGDPERVKLRCGVVDGFTASTPPTYGSLDDGPHVFFEVRDDGVGIPPAVVARMFDPFFTTRGPGRGLGLSVAGGAVRAHRGAILVTSRPGAGTTVRIAIKHILPEASREAAQQEVEPTDLCDTNLIFLADDDDHVRRVCTRVLEKAGYEVKAFADGADLVAQLHIETRPIAGFVLDLAMPRMTGDEALAHVRRRLPAAPVVLISGFTEKRRIDPLLAQGRVTLLHKPFVPDELRRAVAEAMSPTGRRLLRLARSREAQGPVQK